MNDGPPRSSRVLPAGGAAHPSVGVFFAAAAAATVVRPTAGAPDRHRPAHRRLLSRGHLQEELCSGEAHRRPASTAAAAATAATGDDTAAAATAAATLPLRGGCLRVSLPVRGPAGTHLPRRRDCDDRVGRAAAALWRVGPGSLPAAAAPAPPSTGILLKLSDTSLFLWHMDESV